MSSRLIRLPIRIVVLLVLPPAAFLGLASPIPALPGPRRVGVLILLIVVAEFLLGSPLVLPVRFSVVLEAPERSTATYRFLLAWGLYPPLWNLTLFSFSRSSLTRSSLLWSEESMDENRDSVVSWETEIWLLIASSKILHACSNLPNCTHPLIIVW